MKKVISIVSALLAVVCILSGALLTNAETTKSHTRVINVVYDDSRSMFLEGNKAWCYAKYSMEVFAAMLGEEDTMNIFCMSDNGKKPKKLSGKDGPEKNAQKVYDMVTYCEGTPFTTLMNAHSDLDERNADEKWLVIFTDGQFFDEKERIVPQPEVQKYIDNKSKDVNVLFLSIGDGKSEKTSKVKDNPEKGVYFRQAKDSKEILNKITEISTIVFNSNKIKVPQVTDPSFEFDIPMKELTVFAQGENVKINSISVSGKEIIPDSTVNVKNNTKATKKKEKEEDAKKIVTENLSGCVATFTGLFEAGKYKINVSSAKTVEVYYKPDIDIQAKLTNLKGEEVTDLSELEAGEYNIDFFFVHPKTKKKIENSKLLGNVNFYATITNGKKKDKKYSPGDRITIEEGELEIHAVAEYLDYNSVTTDLSYTVYKNKEITFEKVDTPTYNITKNGIENQNDSTRYRMLLDGKEFTAEEWEAMSSPSYKVKDEKNALITDFKVEKLEEVGMISVTPILPAEKMKSDVYEDVEIEIKSTGKQGSSSWKGKADVKISFNDKRSWLERNKRRIIETLIILAIITLIASYLPPFKRYLPRDLASAPKIECKHKDLSIGKKGRTDNWGSVEKSRTLIPFLNQCGCITFVPTSVTDVPPLRVKAKNKRRMFLLNGRDYEDRTFIKFNGQPLNKNVKDIGTGLVITCTKPRVTYTCKLKDE